MTLFVKARGKCNHLHGANSGVEIGQPKTGEGMCGMEMSSKDNNNDNNNDNDNNNNNHDNC